MAGNSFGELFRITTFGESHGLGIGVVIDGCPPGISVNDENINSALSRRRPGQSELTTSLVEPDKVIIQSGVQNGVTTGAPIGLWVENKDVRPADYSEISKAFRPSHADYTYQKKYGILASSGGGRASARETVGRVAAGAIAGKMLTDIHGIDIVAWVSSVGRIVAVDPDLNRVSRSDVDRSLVRCPEAETSGRIAETVQR